MSIFNKGRTRVALLLLFPLVFSLIPSGTTGRSVQSWPGYKLLIWQNEESMSMFLRGLPSDLYENIISREKIKIPIVSFWEDKEIPFASLSDIYIEKDPRYHRFLSQLPSLFSANKSDQQFPLLYISKKVPFSRFEPYLLGYEEFYHPLEAESLNSRFWENIILFLFVITLLPLFTKKWEPYVWAIIQFPIIWSQNSLVYMIVITLIILTYLNETIALKRSIRRIVLVFLGILFFFSWQWIIPFYIVFLILSWQWYPGLVERFKEHRKKRFEHFVFEPVPLQPKKVYSMKLAGILGMILSFSWIFCSFNFSPAATDYKVPNLGGQGEHLLFENLEEQWLEYKNFVQSFSFRSLHEEGLNIQDESPSALSSLSDPFFKSIKKVYLSEIYSQRDFHLSRYMLYLVLPFQLTVFVVVLVKARKKQRILVRIT